ncbi:hypothetical protein B0A50_04977 [Salinomyces thailandicus]|uniref:NFX1-type zinc finger-containing protein 1 n=1 Tax=Salinomyces thailandicus TaxID=706561 RepID=A0A4U0U000_9PEZI|nr:hypothetical protein B0A50_04977 [Salinomyces thailandica]
MAGKKTCHFYQMGRCTKGDKCGFAHVKDPDFKQSERRPPCHAVARGRPCPRGETCTYSHDAAEVAQKDCDRSSQGNGPLESVEATAIRDLLRRWRFKIPRDARERQQKPTVNLAEFLREALELVDAGAETMQEVINALASDGGRFRLDQMLRDCDFEGLGAGALERLWRSQLLPLLQIFSHESVLASRVVEMKYGTLLNELYGLNGTLAVPVFQAVLKSLTAGEKIVVEEFEASLIVLSGVLVMNGSASVNPEFQDVCETFVGLAEGLALTGTASSHLVKIRIRLGLGREIPKVGDNREKLKGPLTLCANFSVARKGPGVLYDDGKSRHDNDHADIREIQILPTMAEIQSDEPEYLPLQDPESWHLQGVAGVIDRHFRLVREDTVGQLRDVANAELERMKNPTGLRQRAKGMRTYTYHNIRLAHAHFDEHKGLQFVLSFDQPEEAGRATSERQRKTWWEDSKRLNPEALVCLLTSDDSAVFFVVASPAFSPARLAEGDTQQPLHDNFNLWRGRTTAYVIVHLADGDDDGTRLLPRLVAGRSDTQRSLIEFPGVVLPAFEPTLKALKVMEESLDLPFANLLCPGATDEVEVRPPAYARREGFRLNVRKLLGDDSTLYLGQDGQFDAEAALQNSTLDQAQQRAAIQALTHQVALIQGPPGTGKSYVGVKLIQVLLDNKTAGRLGPIVCVCFTNHALDQLLEHLVDAGVSQIVRIGSRSKSERLAEVNLRNVAQRYEQTKYEKGQKYWAMRGIKEQATTIKSLLDMLLKVDSDASVKAYLLREHPPVYAQLFHEVDQEGFQRVEHGRGTDALRDWLRGGPRHHPTRARPVRTLQATSQDVHAMSREGRRNLYNSWVEEHAETLRGELAIHISGCKRDKEQLDEVRGDLDSRVLSEASIIGVTTTGLARNLNNLRKLQSKVLIVEEAGEVLEAHLLTAMLPSVEHAILIGDHQQLRPRVQNYDLSSEKPGNEIGLDISLFERLVRPRGGESGHHVLPYSSLETQRRMHPDISQLIRPALYPNLKDAPTVMGYPEVVGMQERLFWLDHRVMEDGKDGSAQSTSRTNTYEVRMVTALVGHLVKQGVYRAEEIAVLTPYLGQLRRLRSAFNGVVEIVLNERDTDDLVREGDGEEDDAELEIAGARRSSVAKGTLSQALRLATVDNFQGEEAEVVIISLVRSNERGDCGFLKTSNRVNVLLSRAQHGMYIIGNSSTSKRVPMWHAVIEQLQNSGRLGDALALRCPRHPETPLLVKQPADFVRLAPEAGCYVIDKTKEFGVDVIEAKTYHEVDLDQTPCIFLQCGHFFTVETLDGHMRMGDHYELDETGGPKALKGNMEPFSYREMKVCFYCRGSLRAIARYGRIVRRALLDESTKKFIAWSNRAYVPLAERLKTEHDILIDTSDRIELSRGNIVLDQTRGHQATTIHQLNASKGRYQKLARLRKDIRNFLQLVGKEEQPFQRVRDMVETARRGNTSNADIPEFRFDQTILQTRGELLATALFIRCDLIAIADLIGAWGKQPPSPSKPRLTVNFAGNRIDSQVLVEKAEKSMIPLQQVEGHIFWAYFAALEVGVMYDPEGNQQHVIRSLDELRRIAHTHVDMAQELCSQYAGQTANVAHEVSEVRRMLNESTTDSEMRMVVAAMATEFSGTGHWYRCENGHPFTIGECGMPMETARCPQCNSRIGGLSHQAVEGVWHAGDIERRFGGMRI